MHPTVSSLKLLIIASAASGAIACAGATSGDDAASVLDASEPPVGESDGGWPGPGTDAGDAPGSDAGPGPGAWPVDELDLLSLVIVVGDSVADGYDAAGNNGPGGHGYARLLVTNHPDFPAYAGHDLETLSPGVDFQNLAESGANSAEALDNLQSALGGSLPTSVAGDVLVLINVGGNDFNDDLSVMLFPAATATAAANLRANVAAMFTLLRDRYEDPAAGKAVVFLVDTIHDTTDGTGSVPPQFDEGFCSTLQSPLLTPALRMTALMNLGTMNAELTAEVALQGGHLVDIHGGFIGHGMNSGTDRWISDDCAHPTNLGHDLIRRMAWEVLTGESF